jgi:2-hydroxycyclohexanecarboxyl-CoA dehydrogenase
VSTALVTGAGQGMGAAIAARLAADGHAVAVNDIVEENAQETAARIGGYAYPFDVADPDACAAAVDEIGAVDILVANHAYMTMRPFEETTGDEWARTIDVNLLGTATLLELVAPGMVERGYGRVVVIASEWGVIGWPNATPYAASKGGLVRAAWPSTRSRRGSPTRRSSRSMPTMPASASPR